MTTPRKPAKKAAIPSERALTAARARQDEEANTDRHKARTAVRFGRCATCRRQHPLDSMGQVANHITDGVRCWGSSCLPSMTREATGVSDMTTLVIEAELVSDRTTKVELRRLLGEQTAALKELRPLRANLGRAQGAVQSAIQDQNSFRAQNRELQHQLSIAQREARDQKDLAAVASARITDLTHDGNLLLERAMKAERHLQVVLDLANSYMKHTT